jgi:Tol biopolymer transport system component
MPEVMGLRDVSADGRALVSQGYVSYSLAGRAAGDDEVRDLSWLGWSLLADISADGEWLLLSDQSVPGCEVWLQRMDGSPPQRLGRGRAIEFSPDGSWVLARQPRTTGPLMLLPTGLGEPREIHTGLDHLGATWCPDGQELIVAAVGPDGGGRLYRQPISGGEPRPISDEGVRVTPPYHCCVSPDGRWIAAVAADWRMRLYPVDGGEPRIVPGIEPRECPLRWTKDSRSLYVARLPARPVHVFVVNVETGERTLWNQLMPQDPSGVPSISYMAIAPEGRAYAYSHGRFLETLYLAEGLK